MAILSTFLKDWGNEGCSEPAQERSRGHWQISHGGAGLGDFSCYFILQGQT